MPIFDLLLSGLYIDWLIPIISPFRFSNGPPEHPGFIAASVCILFLSLSILDIIPVVKVLLKPNGHPIVSTLCPTFISSEFPNFDSCKSSFASIFINAKSFLFFKTAIIFALYSLPVFVVTLMLFEFYHN